ncbi:hypothetical protein [Asticcacaulis sp. YBE204]|uniref:hypothetical protein n=1 Tax=Asticcacaulis sp. YBE204 TaxID=1282363 RepID=UPI0003C3C4C6|nr:hypothetical protein [Asticcacaulis sp. YBE204]ESQ78035.1 hypothetical protein AEYBE204_16190 [Asticcacaulis sp. YBE204]
MLLLPVTVAASAGTVKPELMISPRASQVLNLVPKEVLNEHSRGEVWLRCGWTLKRRLVNCRVTKEVPAGFGFGAAAIQGFETYAYLKKVDAASREGEDMEFRFVWEVK